MDKERFKVPKSVQQAIPIQQIWPDGIFQQGTKFSKTYRFTDINYYIASKDNKTEMFLDYSELLNSLDSGISAQITINNRRINKEEFEKSILLPMKEDGLDHYREEYNEMLLSKITGTNNSIYQERYLTVSVHKRSIDDARTYFARIGTDITHLAKLSSTAEGLDAESRLQIFRDFFKGDVPQAFPFDLKQFAKKGTSFKDWMCPDSMEFERDHFKIGDRYGRVLYMQDYASYVKDDMISELCDFSRNLMLSIDILPVPTDEAVREIQNRLLGVETNVTNWQRRQNANNNFSAIVPYDMELQRKETKEMMDDLLPDIKRLFTKDEDFFAPFGRDGSTIQMGVWAGGRLEGDISTMNFDSMGVPDYLPGPLWVDENGQRFQNEAFAGPEINGFFMARAKRGNITSIYDSTYETQILRGFPGHQAFEYDMPAVVEAMKGNFEAAKAAGAEGANGWYCADTIEQLAEYIGVEPAALSATVEQYNKVCAEGYDSDFAKDPHFLNAVAKAPFYAHVTTPSLGFALVTTGGFVTTNDQQVLNEDYQPIEGLYASGNTCGMRFGPEYITPIPGVSIGMCLTLGRELGKYLAAK